MPKKRAADSSISEAGEDTMASPVSRLPEEANDMDDPMNDSNNEDEEMEDGEASEMEPSPSPLKKKDMMLRSGRRKRRRSLDTTGLTPPATLKKSKKARKSVATTAKKAPPSALPNTKSVAKSSTAPIPKNGDTKQAASTSEKQLASPGGASPMPDPRRISYSIAASMPSNILEDQMPEEPADPTENPVAILDVVPPKPFDGANGTLHVEGGSSDQQHPEEEQPNISVVQEDNTGSTIVDSNETEIENVDKIDVGDADGTSDSPMITETTVKTTLVERITIFVFWTVLSLWIVMPQVVRLTHIVIPLDDSILPPLSKPVEPHTESEALNAWNEKFSNDLHHLLETRKEFQSSTEDFIDHYDKLTDRMREYIKHIRSIKELKQKKLDDLIALETLLETGEDRSDWEQAKDLAQTLFGKTLFETSTIALWDISEDAIVDCEVGIDVEEEKEGIVDDDDLKLLSNEHLEEMESHLTLRSAVTAQKFVSGSVARDRIQSWIQSEIAKGIEGDEDSEEILSDIQKLAQEIARIVPSNKPTDNGGDGSSNEVIDQEIDDIIQRRLDVHRADTTGTFDYASLKNGAEILYGGKRGSSKSLIDSLPIVNRVLQTSNLRFYGFGPEAALTPTHPPNSLGQCWSFQETPLKEQLQERELYEKDTSVPNDFKRGNYGTLTIRLASPISVESIIIEHAPARLTDQAKTAIRSFRLVGYEDDKASSQSWNLGSFEYSLEANLKNNEYLQEFKVASTVFGKEIPPLRSISLAIDSNYGHEYACLYRFRVHGVGE